MNRQYIKRITDTELERKLSLSGALLIRGPKACGKTASATQFASSAVTFDRDEQVPLLMETDPRRLLMGNTPRLIDEWQAFPKIWNYVRHEVNDRKQSAQFILTGSSRPEESIKMHSGAGRFTVMDMRTMTWQELGYSTGKIRLKDLYEYLDALERLMIIENQPAWNTHIRSSSSLRKSPKRHFTDVSLAVAVLGADKETLLNDLKCTGFLFESLAVHELRVYAQANDAKVYHYQDSSGLEVDAIVQKHNGDWCAFEIKLGTGQIEDAAKSLNKFSSIIDTKRIKPPKSLNIITGTGMSYTRKDGINVLSLKSLGAW